MVKNVWLEKYLTLQTLVVPRPVRARRLDAGALMGLGEANSAVGGLPATGSDESRQSSRRQSSKNTNNKQTVK